MAAQMIMLPIALLVGYKADTWGRRPLFLVGFAILQSALSSTCFPTTVPGSRGAIDGWRRCRHLRSAHAARARGPHARHGPYNVAQGAVATFQGIGASLSGLVAGEIVDHFGYSAAFVTLGIAALVALAAFFFGMPERPGSVRKTHPISDKKKAPS